MSYLSTVYTFGSHLPPGALGEVSAFSDWWQRRFRRGHDADGTHNDPLVPHAWAICTLTGAGVVVVKSSGVGAATRLSPGRVRFTITKAMATWQALAWPIHRADSGAPYYAYEAQDAGAIKDATRAEIQLIAKDGTASDINFAFAARGVRA